MNKYQTYNSIGDQPITAISAIKANSPKIPEQARVASLQNQKGAASKAINLERNRQKIQWTQQPISVASSKI